MDYKDKINELLLQVEKPARYTGGEYNTPVIDKPYKARLLLCFPDIYEVGMSNLGISILYHLLNSMPEFVCERCFAPWGDFAEVMRKNDVPLLSIESKTPAREFDAIGFSVQYELLYTNILYMFDLAGIPFYAKDRGEEYPIMIAGGPCTVNPEPFAEFFDIIEIGEGEEMLPALMRLIAEGKEKGWSKREVLEKAKNIEGLYVPAYIKEGEKVVKAVVDDFENAFYPTKPLIPNIEVIHDRAVLELYRGCASGCRFCQAGFYYRSIRERTAKKSFELAKEMLDNSGFDEMSLASLSTGDYSELLPLITDLQAMVKEKRVNLALPSLRLNSFEGAFAMNTRMNSLTFAPEAGTQRLRDVINKNITEDDIFGSLSQAFAAGYDHVKLYFMLGLPTETDEDLLGIVDLVKRIRKLYLDIVHKKRLTISVSCSVFIPKPVTPFQWERQISIPEMLAKQSLLRKEFQPMGGVSFSWHGAEGSVIEAALARGDKRLNKVLVRAYELGSRFDGWTEFFDWNKWTQAFADCGVDMADYTGAHDEAADLPWDFIDTGVTKAYLLKEKKLAYEGKTTRNCREGCNGCGANKRNVCLKGGGVC